MIVEEKPEQINNMLAVAGILKVEDEEENRRDIFPFSSRSSFRSYSDNNMSANEFCKKSVIQLVIAGMKKRLIGTTESSPCFETLCWTTLQEVLRDNFLIKISAELSMLVV